MFTPHISKWFYSIAWWLYYQIYRTHRYWRCRLVVVINEESTWNMYMSSMDTIADRYGVDKETCSSVCCIKDN